MTVQEIMATIPKGEYGTQGFKKAVADACRPYYREFPPSYHTGDFISLAVQNGWVTEVMNPTSPGPS